MQGWCPNIIPCVKFCAACILNKKLYQGCLTNMPVSMQFLATRNGNTLLPLPWWQGISFCMWAWKHTFVDTGTSVVYLKLNIQLMKMNEYIMKWWLYLVPSMTSWVIKYDTLFSALYDIMSNKIYGTLFSALYDITMNYDDTPFKVCNRYDWNLKEGDAHPQLGAWGFTGNLREEAKLHQTQPMTSLSFSWGSIF